MEHLTTILSVMVIVLGLCFAGRLNKVVETKVNVTNSTRNSCVAVMPKTMEDFYNEKEKRI